jgi:ABC-type lipoprotein export system ATPase subunit
MKKIDMAISFAFVDIIKLHRQIDYNITFYDEILDSSLDNKNLENLVHFISEHNKSNNKAIYIVTHKNDITLPEINEVITMEKRGGFTRKLES